MNKPASYKGSALLRGRVSDFSKALDPSNWQSNASQIWRASYPIDSIGAPMANPPGLASSPLPPARSLPPKRAARNPSNPKMPGLFFEEVLFGGSAYRNVLTMSCIDDSGKPNPKITVEYGQFGCLNTRSALFEDEEPEDGGIDVDRGIIECIPKPKNQVQVTISKSVRFTKPTELVDQVNQLAHVLVPLTLDVWLHSLIFQI